MAMENKVLTKKKLKVEKFEGLLCSYPMAVDGNKALCWVIEHHAKESRGGYVVTIGDHREVFFKLEKAVDYYNNGGKKKNG